LALNPRIKSKIEVEKFNQKVEAGIAKEPRPKLGDPVQIAQMRQSGKSFASISRELGSTQGIVQRRFDESGQDDPAARRLSLDMTEILKLRREGESFTVIGRRFSKDHPYCVTKPPFIGGYGTLYCGQWASNWLFFASKHRIKRGFVTAYCV
jgi:hypothetical protein